MWGHLYPLFRTSDDFINGAFKARVDSSLPAPFCHLCVMMPTEYIMF